MCDCKSTIPVHMRGLKYFRVVKF